MLKVNYFFTKFELNYNNFQIIKSFSTKRKSFKMSSPSSDQETRVAILWFRNDLRLHDNSILREAIELVNKKKLDKLVPFYCFDQDLFEGKSRLLQIPRCGSLRRNFLIESVENLKKNLISKLESNLLTSYGQPDKEIIKLVDEIQSNSSLKLEQIISTREIPSEEVDLELKLKEELTRKRVNLKLLWDQTMIHLDDLPVKSIDKLPDMFTQLRKLVELRGQESVYNVREPFRIPSNCTLPILDSINFNRHEIPAKENLPQLAPNKSAIENMNGGEDEALKRVENYFFKSNGLKLYKSTRNGLLGTEYSSKLSMWLALGCVSPRFLYYQVKEYEAKFKPNESTVHFVFELLWRDFFKFNALKYGKRIFYLNGFRSNASSNYVKWKTCDNKWDKDLFEKWCSGDTGYPFVDANMKELNQTG